MSTETVGSTPVATGTAVRSNRSIIHDSFCLTLHAVGALKERVCASPKRGKWIQTQTFCHRRVECKYRDPSTDRRIRP